MIESGGRVGFIIINVIVMSMILYDEGCLWRETHLDVNFVLYSFIEEEWGTRETCFYPSHTVKTIGFVGDGGGKVLFFLGF